MIQFWQGIGSDMHRSVLAQIVELAAPEDYTDSKFINTWCEVGKHRRYLLDSELPIYFTTSHNFIKGYVTQIYNHNAEMFEKVINPQNLRHMRLAIKVLKFCGIETDDLPYVGGGEITGSVLDRVGMDFYFNPDKIPPLEYIKQRLKYWNEKELGDPYFPEVLEFIANHKPEWEDELVFMKMGGFKC